MTNKKPRLLFIAALLTVWLNVAVASAQTGTSDPLNALPTSDVVAFIDVRRIMTEIVPRLLAKDPATLAKMTSAINELNTKTGINLLGIDRVAGGMQFVGPATHQMKKESLGIAVIVHGDFNANALVEFLKSEGKGKLGMETYGGKTIYSEPQPAPPRKKAERETAACAILDSNTFVIGDLPQVRATIDAATGKSAHADSKLVELATRDSSSLIGMAGNFPESLARDLSETAPKDDQMAQAATKIIANIKQIFGSIGGTPSDFNIIFGARLGTPEQAQSMNDLLLGLRQQATPHIEDKKARDLIERIQITAQGDEVQLKASIPNEVVQDFAADIIKENQPAAKKPTTPKTKQTTKARRSRRRRRH
jgi:hypothetical protein